MATTASSSVRLKSVCYVPRSLKQHQLQWCVSQEESEVGGRPMMLQISIIDYSSDGPKEWICQRAVRENFHDVYDMPSHLLVPGHRYVVIFKLMPRDQSSSRDEDDEFSSLMQAYHTKTLNFRLGELLLSMGYAWALCKPSLRIRLMQKIICKDAPFV